MISDEITKMANYDSYWFYILLLSIPIAVAVKVQSHWKNSSDELDIQSFIQETDIQKQKRLEYSLTSVISSTLQPYNLKRLFPNKMRVNHRLCKGSQTGNTKAQNHSPNYHSVQWNHVATHYVFLHTCTSVYYP